MLGTEYSLFPPCSHLRTAFVRAPGVGSGPTAAIILQTERVERGEGGGEGIRGHDTNTESVSNGGERKRKCE